jgi:hypothetical protein
MDTNKPFMIDSTANLNFKFLISIGVIESVYGGVVSEYGDVLGLIYVIALARIINVCFVLFVDLFF